MVQAADGNIVALIEVKNLNSLSADTAATIRRNLVVHGRTNWWPSFFMVVSQDRGYLWDQRSLPPEPTQPPTTEFPMSPVVAHYLPSFAGGARLRGSQLELAVEQWLWDLANDVEQRPHVSERALATTGFLEMVRGGRVSTEIGF